MHEPQRARAIDPRPVRPVRAARQARPYLHAAGASERHGLAGEIAVSTMMRSGRRTEPVHQDSRVADHVGRRGQEPRECLPQVETSPAPHRRDLAEQLSCRLVPPSLWAVVEPLIPPAKVRRQGGGRGRVCDRAVFTAIALVLTSGSAWRHLPASFGVTVPTAHRRFQEWTGEGLWGGLRRALQDGRIAGSHDVEWMRGVLDAADARSCRSAGRALPVPVGPSSASTRSQCRERQQRAAPN
jgi:transposase